MNNVYLSMGSNLGDKKQNLLDGLHDIQATIGEIEKTSAIYESEAWGFDSENSFLNLALKLNTDFDVMQLLHKLQSIEKQNGRKIKTTNNYSDRTLDIDILYFNNQIINFEDLEVPHIRMYERQFVLQPLKEIAADFIDPSIGKTISEIQRRCPDKSNLKHFCIINLNN